jgi:DNA polymerase-3 subunit epsilon
MKDASASVKTVGTGKAGKTGFTGRVAGLLQAIRKGLGRWSGPVHPLLEENYMLFAEFDQEKPIEEYSFVVLDTELTGLSPSRDEIVSIGAVRVSGLSINPSDTLHVMVRPHGAMHKPATLVHRITPETVADKPPIEDVLPELLRFCNGSLIVGHHVGLDMAFLSRATRRHLGGSIATPCIDTMRLAQAWEQERWEASFDPFQSNISYNLRDLATHYGLPRFQEHDALQDALQAAYLFVYLVRKMRGGSIRTLKDLFMAGRSWRWYM